LKILITDDNSGGVTTTTNVVYKEVFHNIWVCHLHIFEVTFTEITKNELNNH
jgi:hypothetical protein